MLKFRIEGQKLTWENPDEVVVAGTKKYLECYFEFDGDAWSGFEYIEAFFKNGRDKPIRMLLSANRIWKEDRLCLSAGDWSVYLRAMVSKKKLDEEGNVIYEEDGVTPVMELEKQMTSSSVSIRVLAHGQFENAQNSFESPEIAEQYIEQMLYVGKAMSVFEEYDPEKEYFKHNRVAFEGASYVLIAESAQGINPTDTGSWLCIAEKGDNGATIYPFPIINIKVGDKLNVPFNWELYDKEDHPGADNWKKGDILISENGKVLEIVDIVRASNNMWYVDFKCFADIKGEPGKDGKDAVLPDGNMSLCVDAAFLPANAKVGDVYRVTTTIYDNGVYYIPIQFTGAFDVDKNTLRYSFESDSGYEERVVYALEDMLEKGVSNFKLSDDEKEYNVPLSGAGVIDHGDGNYEYYFDSTLVSEEMYSRGAMFIHLPEEIGDEHFAERKAIKFKKGDFAVFTGDGWESYNSLEIKNIKQALADEKSRVDNKFGDLSYNYAYNSLGNVSNEDFKRKAEEAGVGGDAGLAGEGCVMKFMHEVSALPETANDGEVYSVNPWESAGAYDGSGTEFYDNGARFEGWNALGNALYQDIQNYYAWTYKFVLSNGTELIYKECAISSAGEWGFEMLGYCTDSNINLTLANGEIVDVYRTYGEPKDNDSYVRFNNKWVKL